MNMMKKALIVFIILNVCIFNLASKYIDYFSIAESISQYELQHIIDTGLNVNSNLPIGYTPLTIAAISSREDLIQELLENGANVNAENQRTGKGTLFTLIWVCWNLNIYKIPYDIVSILIDAGADVNERDSESGNTILMYLVSYYSDPEILKLLIENGARVDSYNKTLQRPLHLIAKNSLLMEHARILLDNGADINSKDEKGRTPLMVAADEGTSPEMISFFLSAGADANILDDYNLKAYDYASVNEDIFTTEEYWMLSDKTNRTTPRSIYNPKTLKPYYSFYDIDLDLIDELSKKHIIPSINF